MGTGTEVWWNMTMTKSLSMLYSRIRGGWMARKSHSKTSWKALADTKAGFEKIEFCRKRATSDRLEHIWVDTCCIDNSSSAKLTEAINSMCRWYQNADKCYVYLSDISTSEHATNPKLSTTMWEAAFRGSRWFSRGWTLQELIAPASV